MKSHVGIAAIMILSVLAAGAASTVGIMVGGWMAGCWLTFGMLMLHFGLRKAEHLQITLELEAARKAFYQKLFATVRQPASPLSTHGLNEACQCGHTKAFHIDACYYDAGCGCEEFRMRVM